MREIFYGQENLYIKKYRQFIIFENIATFRHLVVK